MSMTDRPHTHDTHGGHDTHDTHSGHGTHGGHDAHDTHSGHGGHGDHVGQFRRLFWVMLVLAVPVIGFSPMFAMLLGYELPAAGWVGVDLSAAGHRHVRVGRSAVPGRRGRASSAVRQPGMMLLIGLAITVAFLASWGASLGAAGPRARLLVGAGAADRDHAARPLDRDAVPGPDHLGAGLAGRLLPDEAERVDRRQTVTVDANGTASWVTGRRAPRWPGPRRRHGSVSGIGQHGRVDDHRRVQAGPAGRRRHRGRRHRRHRLRRCGSRSPPSARTPRWPASNAWSADAQNSSSRAQRIADRAAAWLFWFALGRRRHHRHRLDGARAARPGCRSHDHRAGHRLPARPRPGHPAGRLHRHRTRRPRRRAGQGPARAGVMRTVDTVLFDKTGTLTKGQPTVTAIHTALANATSDEVLALAASAETDSEHPLARAIVSAARAPRPPAATASEFNSSPGGRGDRPPSTAARSRSAAPTCCSSTELAEELAVADQWRAEGAIILHVLADGHVSSVRSELADEIREESRDAVDALHARERAGGDDHRRRRGRRRLRRRRARHRPVLRRRPARGQVRQGQTAPGRGPRRSPWSATASTTHPPSPRPMSGSPSAPAPTSRSPRPVSSWPATTPGRCCR